jgi:biopolymer transport protein TolQ
MTPHIATDAATMSPLALFLQADIVVKIVMIGLLVASLLTWWIILAQGGRIRRILAKTGKFERDFWASEDIDNFYTANRNSDLPVAKVLGAGVTEWRRSTAGKRIDREGTRERLSTTMSAATANEVDKLADRLNWLATIGSVAPFVGLFGTVWGIMRSFTSIAAQQNTSLGVVAPGIAEALFATALGLFAAIPAVIAYNRLSHGINKLEARLHRFADGFHATLSRELESE